MLRMEIVTVTICFGSYFHFDTICLLIGSVLEKPLVVLVSLDCLSMEG